MTFFKVTKIANFQEKCNEIQTGEEELSTRISGFAKTPLQYYHQVKL